jgi:putative flippase GtrA
MKLFSYKPARYLIVGGTCAVAHNVIMIGGDWLGGHYLLMSCVSFLLVTPLGYLLHSAFTFGERLSWIGLLRFASGIAIGFPISILSMVLLCTGLGLPVLIAAPIATLILFVWNYVTAHWAILGRLRLRDLS